MFFTVTVAFALEMPEVRKLCYFNFKPGSFFFYLYFFQKLMFKVNNAKVITLNVYNLIV